jgi:hypothetical protein
MYHQSVIPTARRNVGRILRHTRFARLLIGCLIFAVTALPVTAESVDPATAAAAMDRFIADHGGAEAIGQPVSPLQPDSEFPGVYHRYYENFQLDYWPELAGTDYVVQPALLGSQETRMRNFPTVAPFQSEDTVYYFPETVHSVRFGFLDFFLDTGGLQLLGYPISEELADGDTTIQYFQRGVLRFTPGMSPAIRAKSLGRTFYERVNSPWQASVGSALPDSVIGAGGTVNIAVTMTNEGSAAWEPGGANPVTLSYRWKGSLPSSSTIDGIDFALPGPVVPGQSVSLNVAVPAPEVGGQYTLIWDPRVGGRWMSELGQVSGEATVVIGGDAPSIRVAIMELGPDNDDDEQATVSATAAFQITTLSGAVIASLSAGERVVLDYEETQIRITLPGQEPRIISEPISIRTEPGFFMIVDEIQPGNLYRGEFEFRYSDVLESAWLIDILPVNDYLAGLIEQGEEAPWESLKASVITFRSYALAVQARLKIKNFEPFDIASSTTHTPSYFTRHMFSRGFVRELAGPRLRQAIEATRGQVITYQGEIIEAPFFTQAGGYTISHKDAGWGAARPWAPGVEDPVSADDWFIGHGVGMPLQSSNKLANLGYAAEQIVKFYFIGVDIGYAY